MRGDVVTTPGVVNAGAGVESKCGETLTDTQILREKYVKAPKYPTLTF